MLEIKNLSVSLGRKQLLKNIDLSVNDGARHLLRGSNGSGKTTLVQTIACGGRGKGHDYVIESGGIIFNGADISDLPTCERARLGIFFGAQHVPEIPGLSVTSFLKHSLTAHAESAGGKGQDDIPALSAGEFFTRLTAARERLSIPESWTARSINVGFSGGEKKRLMFLHLLMLRPRLAILDEPDSGVDADTQQIFADIIMEMNAQKTSFLIISHQEKFTKMISPTQTTSLSDGKVMI